MADTRYEALVDDLAARILDGRLPPGTRLPTHRALARRHGVALVTASRAYAELAARGLVHGEVGRGTFVRETALPRGHGVDQRPVEAGTVDLAFNYPVAADQAEMLRAGLRQLAAGGDLEALLRYAPHAGRPRERAAVARHLAARGVPAEADRGTARSTGSPSPRWRCCSRGTPWRSTRSPTPASGCWRSPCAWCCCPCRPRGPVPTPTRSRRCAPAGGCARST